MPSATDPHPQRPAEWSLLDDIQHDSRANPELAEVAQRLAIPVPDPLDAKRLTERCLGQRSGPAFHMRTVRGWDGITMRIVGRMAEERVDALPTGQCRLVELGRSLATKPEVLLLDEPASGQDETETAQFAALLRELAREGMVVVLVEHDVHLVMNVCETVHVLDFGQIIAVGTPTVPHLAAPCDPPKGFLESEQWKGRGSSPRSY